MWHANWKINSIDRHDAVHPVYVDGPFRVWIRENQVNYFTLMADEARKDFGEQFEDTTTESEECTFTFYCKTVNSKMLDTSLMLVCTVSRALACCTKLTVHAILLT